MSEKISQEELTKMTKKFKNKLIRGKVIGITALVRFVIITIVSILSLIIISIIVFILNALDVSDIGVYFNIADNLCCGILVGIFAPVCQNGNCI